MRLNFRTFCNVVIVRKLLLVLALFQMGSASAYHDLSANDYGQIGLLQIPTARFARDGEFRLGVSTVYPYNQLLFSMEILPGLEAGFRYAEVSNRLFGPREFSGDQSYKDRSIDLKIRLREESPNGPAIALGIVDLGGTGIFASEYLVFSKGNQVLDWTLGIGWGRLGARGGVRNPFVEISESFSERPRTEDRGDIGFDRLFGGREIGIFAGVHWQTPVKGLSVKLELDGNDYQSEALDNNQDSDLPLNLGINYRIGRRFDVGIGLERGNTAMVRLAFATDLNWAQGPPKLFDPPSTPVAAWLSTKPDNFVQAKDFDQTFFDRLQTELGRQHIRLVAAEPNTETGNITVWIRQTLSDDSARAALRVGQALAILAPETYTQFTISYAQVGSEAYRVTLNRSDIRSVIDFDNRTTLLASEVLIEQPVSGADIEQQSFASPAKPFSIFPFMGPNLRQHVGGADDFYFGQLWWEFGAELKLSERWTLSGTVGVDIYNNFDGLRQPSDSQLPHVRSDIVRYLREGQNNLVNLETNYLWSPADNWYARLSAGIFEEMFGGIAGEVLYRPFDKSWAVGVNLNRVRQRDYDQKFDFLDYEITTGHVTLYWDLPIKGMSVLLSGGRYLAGDHGGTLSIGRTFESGIQVGAFLTKTNVSSEEFGEGNFDRGFFVSVPIDVLFAASYRGRAGLLFRPLTRDGGQKVRDGISLYGLTGANRIDHQTDWSGALR